MSRYLSIAEVAKLFQVQRDTAYSWIKRFDLPAVKAGGRIVVEASRLEQWINNRPAGQPLPHSSHKEAMRRAAEMGVCHGDS